MINLGAIARLVNIMREFSPEVAKQAVTELWELQQAVNRIDANAARILAILEVQQNNAKIPEGAFIDRNLPAPALLDLPRSETEAAE